MFVLSILGTIAVLTAAQAAEQSDEKLLPAAPLNEQVLSLPGDPARPVTLQVTLFMPDGPGPFPLAVMNHGASSDGHPRDEPRYRLTFSAYYFLSRGYAVALPMMRGYASSGGTAAAHGCDVAASGLDNAKDIAAVIDSLAKDPKIDANRIVVAGQSLGGWNALAFGTLGHPGVKGLINFVGGMRESDCADQDAALARAAGTLGAQTKVPSIWLYGDNDKIFPVATWRAMYVRYTGAGGKAELVAFGNFMDDAHQLLSHPEGLPIWVPKVDAFLAQIGLPAAAVHPKYLPTPFPPATHYAAIGDVAAVPYLGDAGRKDYEAFLHQPLTRAFVVAPNGTYVVADGGFDAIARALALCGSHAAGCQLYAVDNDVVWKKDEAAAPVYQRTVAAGASTFLNFAYNLNPDCSTKDLPKIQLTQQPTHGTAKIEQRSDFPRFPATSPYAVCNDRQVPGMSVEYTPQTGFAGVDALAFEETTPPNHDTVFRLAITVK
jgi:dienelactone hydrolase